MAFVFRSEKKPIFQEQIITKDLSTQTVLASNPTNVSQKQIDLTKVAKGLPCNKQKLARLAEQSTEEVGLPEFQIKTIHRKCNLGTLKQIFSLDKTLNKQVKDEKENSKTYNQAIESKSSSKLKKSSLLLTLTKNTKKNSHFGEKLLLKDLKIQSDVPHITNCRSQPNIVNKNLLKTLSSLKSKSNTSQDLQQLNIISQKGLKTAFGQRSSKGFNFHSMKKLSPIKSIIKQTVHQENGINLFLSKEKLPQDQKSALKRQKNQIQKLKQSIRSQVIEKQDEQEDQEYDEDATPGPGAYNFENWDTRKHFRSKKEKFKKIFYSSLDRFQNSLKFNQVTLVNDEKQPQSEEKDKNIKCISFLSNSPRFDKEKLSIIPPPGYYNTRQTLQYDLIKNILKSSNTNTFINTQSRQPQSKKKDQLPGPGAYNVDNSIQKIAYQHGVPTFAYKSRLPRNLQYEPVEKEKTQTYHDSVLQNDQNKDFRPIHVQRTQMLPADYQIQVPPFMSNSERFPNLKPICKESNSKIVTQVQPKKQLYKQAFNSSQKRRMQSKIGEGVGVGLYNLLAKESWTRKSHNILFS